jgi:hypothetical protein
MTETDFVLQIKNALQKISANILVVVLLKKVIFNEHFMIIWKGRVTRFLTLGFFHQSTPYMSLINRLNPFCIWQCICQDNRFESRQIRVQYGVFDTAETENWGLGNPQLFSASSTYLVWGCLPLKYFCWIPPLKEEKVNGFRGVIDNAEIISAVSLILGW